MKKILYPVFVLLFCAGSLNAAVVVSQTAQTVASNFYKFNAQKPVTSVTLTHEEKTPAGEPAYYVFNINDNEGFVIVSAEDAGKPIIGYSTEGAYMVPSASSNPEMNFWMEMRKEEIISMRQQNLQADAETSKQWTSYINNKNYYPKTMSTPHPALCQTNWNQSGGGSIPYNYYCPGGSVTGCVATAMSMIMKFWAYPTQGTGSHSYNAGSYGTLSANYGTTTYNWASMPNNSSNSAVATINYHCGVAVNMSYSPSGSGAYVCGNNPSAEYAFKTYFKYDPTLHCVWQTGYSTSAWCALLVAEFAAGRPTQYQGANSAGGHTWICDGNDAQDNMHMNWGWGGWDNGYYAVTNLAPAGNSAFTTQLGALIGIKPQVPTTTLDLGATAITSPNGTTCNQSVTPTVTIKNFGSTTVTSCKILYNLDGAANQTYNWSGTLASFQTATVTLPAISAGVGAHIFNTSTSLPNGSSDGNTVNDQTSSILNVLSNTASKTGSYSESFESSGFPYADCYIYTSSGPQWATTSTAATTGTNSLKLLVQGVTTADADEFITPSIDMTNTTSGLLTFYVAHAQASSGDVDQLQVLSSTNCGGAWVQRYSKAGSTLSTAGVIAGSFTPSGSSQWRQETVNLAAVVGNPDVRFKFKFNGSGAGNNVYLDDINITTAGNGVEEEFANGFTLNIFPNPMTDQTNITFTLNDKYNVAIGVYDLIGKEIIPVAGSSGLNAGTYSLPLNKNALTNGVYLVKLNVDGYVVTRKVIVQ